MDKQEFRWLMLIMQTRGGGWVQSQSATMRRIEHETALTFFFEPLSKSFVWMRD